METTAAMFEKVQNNFKIVRQRIQQAAESVHRSHDEIKLVVVTKGRTMAAVQAAIHCGATDFGENYPEEAQEKIASTADYPDLHWHMIGHLQSRKARIVASQFDFMHSLDSLHLAQKLDAVLSLTGRILPVLLEFNLGGEESKYGWKIDREANLQAIMSDIEAILQLVHLKVYGLMTFPPYYLDSQKTRPFFIKLMNLRDELSRLVPEISWKELSMGTSADYEVAIQEGATIVRIGQALFGTYKKQ